MPKVLLTIPGPTPFAMLSQSIFTFPFSMKSETPSELKISMLLKEIESELSELIERAFPPENFIVVLDTFIGDLISKAFVAFESSRNSITLPLWVLSNFNPCQ